MHPSFTAPVVSSLRLSSLRLDCGNDAVAANGITAVGIIISIRCLAILGNSAGPAPFPPSLCVHVLSYGATLCCMSVYFWHSKHAGAHKKRSLLHKPHEHKLSVVSGSTFGTQWPSVNQQPAAMNTRVGSGVLCSQRTRQL